MLVGVTGRWGEGNREVCSVRKLVSLCTVTAGDSAAITSLLAVRAAYGSFCGTPLCLLLHDRRMSSVPPPSNVVFTSCRVRSLTCGDRVTCAFSHSAVTGRFIFHFFFTPDNVHTFWSGNLQCRYGDGASGDY